MHFIYYIELEFLFILSKYLIMSSSLDAADKIIPIVSLLKRWVVGYVYIYIV